MTIKTTKEIPMKKAIILMAALIFSAVSFGCGGTSEKKETKSPTAISNTNTVPSNANSSVAANDRDADDMKGNTAGASNSKSKTGDADDQRPSNRTGSTNRPVKRGDADDRGKNDSDGDDDDR